MTRQTRWNSLMPYRASSAAIAALVADCVKFNSLAACVTCCRSATAMKIRSCSKVMMLTHQFDQREAEARDEQGSECPEQSGPKTSRCQFADVCFEAHRGQCNRQQQCRRGDDACPGIGGDRDQTIDGHERYESEYEQWHRRTCRSARVRLPMFRLARGHQSDCDDHRCQKHHAGQFGDRSKCASRFSMLECRGNDLGDFMDRRAGPKSERMRVEMQKAWE